MSAKRSTSHENSRAVHISPHNFGTVIGSGKIHLRQMESRLLGFHQAINQLTSS